MMALAVQCTACGACSRPGMPDGGLDATALDAPLDRGRTDAAADWQGPRTCSDAPNADWSCPLVPEGDSGWSRLGCAPAECSLRIAQRPAEERPQFAWIPCANGRPGCREMSRAWARGNDGARVRGLGAHTALGPYLWTDIQLSRLGPAEAVLLAADGTGATFAATFQTGPGSVVCLASIVGISDTAAAVSVSVILDGPGAAASVFWGPLNGGSRWLRPTVVFDWFTCGLTSTPWRFALDDDTLVTELLPIGNVYRIDLPGPRAVRIATRDDVNGAPGDPVLAGDAVFVHGDRFGSPVDEWVIARGQPPRPFIRRMDRDVYGFRADESVMAWLEGVRTTTARDAGFYAEITLWSAPLAFDEASVRARRLGHVPTSDLSPEPTLAFGRYAYFETWTRVRVVNLADATSWPIDCDPAYQWSIPIVWLGPEEIALGIRGPDETPGNASITIQRIRFDALGPPEPLVP